MKNLLLLTILFIPAIALSQTIKDFYLEIPETALPNPNNTREKLITETNGNLLKFRLSEARRGEVKIFNQKKDETLLGMAISDCNSSSLQFWAIKKGIWKDVTKDVIKPLGKNDVFAILRVSSATVTSPNQSLDIAYFYNFLNDSTNLELFARKQDSCDVAGKVYDYKFNGKKFEIQK